MIVQKNRAPSVFLLKKLAFSFFMGYDNEINIKIR